VNHNISRRLVGTATVSSKAIALEDLSGIRERASVMNRDGGWNLRREMRFELSLPDTFCGSFRVSKTRSQG
jgi:hypothetical protein